MTRLIVEEGGQRRAFRLGEGVLTLGSGAEAKLRLKSTDVAEIHAEIEVRGDVVRLRPRPGVLPPTVGGQPVSAGATLEPGQVVEVGSARIWIDDGGQGHSAQASSASTAAKSATAAKPGARQVRRTPATPGKDRSVVHRTQPRIKKGIPAWLTIVIILGVAGIAIAFYAKVTRDMGVETAASPQSRIDRARDLSQIQRADILALREEIKSQRARAELDVGHLLGTKYLDVMLKKYEAKYLAGEPETAKVRLFLMRCKEFRKRWPRHPDMNWVDRLEGRFAGYVDLSAPPSWDDVQWEIFYMAGGAPRNYRGAFTLLTEFERRATPVERVEVQELREKLIGERLEYHTDKIYQAEYEFNKKDNPSKSVWWLLHAVIWIGDEEMENEAAAFLIKIPNLQGHLEGYERDYPERYAAVLQHPIVREFAREKGMLDGEN